MYYESTFTRRCSLTSECPHRSAMSLVDTGVSEIKTNHEDLFKIFFLLRNIEGIMMLDR